ncbi:Pyridoxamine 5\\'-phosphate oxidase-related FMN-binding [Nitrospira defluvii]|uniref:Pyridoxamine 5'-phosphate oxidase-related FMN-binding protein n=3 Tax=Nitrospiraceae TaxID=189779 RepID=A0AA86MZ50_9BACT|nr:Pyridoxamine 5\\'-phosphate oxidase-related FMN-binding [Nitrospira defluvii]CAI4031724.1 Pyridoxamine 5'-phosphate oxidase-related FMN-binding protein [Nitrospira tepida]
MEDGLKPFSIIRLAEGKAMARKYLHMTMTESVRRAQQQYYGHAATITDVHERDPLSDAEAQFIADRDSFYLGSVSETGWPYVQHRGGPKGFLKVLDPATLAFADYRGNRQLLSTGNLFANDQVALFLMDYKNRERLKILGHARVEDVRDHSALAVRLTQGDSQPKAERIVIIEVVSYDWNCPKYITPRYSIDEVEELVGPLKSRIAELEAQLRSAQD